METTQIHKKKWYKKKKIIIPLAIVVVLVIGGIVQAQRGNKGPQYETTVVERGTLKQTVDATGNIESSDEIDLRFETSGRVAAVHVKANDTVKKGTLIASLSVSELNARIAQAQASVNRYQANLDKLLAGETTAYISNLKAKLDQAKAQLAQIQATDNDVIDNAIAALDKARYNLQLAEGGDDSAIVQDAYEDMVALLQKIQNTLADALTESDNILGIDNTFANDDFEEVLSSLDMSALNQAKQHYYVAQNAKRQVDHANGSISLQSSHADIDATADVAASGLVSMKTLLLSMSTVLDKTIPIGNLSQTELDTLKSNITTSRASVNTDYTSLINQMQAVRSAQNSYDTYLVAYSQAQKNVDNVQAKAAADTLSYQALVDQAQANYDDALNPPRNEDVADAKAQLAGARAGLSEAIATRNKAIITAPVAGVIGKTNIRVGDYVGVSDVVAQLVSPHFEVRVDIPETDIIKLSVGNSADITLDAFGDDVHFMGHITEIEVGQTIIQDVIYYTVTVSLDEEQQHDYEILTGMTTNVVFSTEEKSDVLYVPQRVILSDDAGKYVRVLHADTTVENVYVKTGLRADDGLIEITSGLTEGQVVVVKEIVA